MSGENIDRRIEFILEHQAKFSEDVERLAREIQGLNDVQAQQAENINLLTADVQLLNETVSLMRSEMQTNWIEVRDAINNLIVSNEVTRDFANKIAQLAIATSQRVTNLEPEQ